MLNSLPYLSAEKIRQFIHTAFAEDVGIGDQSSLAVIPPTAVGKAQLIVKSEGILAGIELAQIIFAETDPTLQVEILLQDGAEVHYGDIGLRVVGNARAILQAERLVLNCMQRMSGIASYTNQAVKATAGTKTKIWDTRKTTPNFRMFEKWAVKIGGGENHRFGLFDMIMLKDNHIDYAGGIEKALRMADEYRKKENPALWIDVETRNLAEVAQALQTGIPNVIMLDNMDTDMMQKAVEMVAGKCKVEASGGITLADIPKVAACGVDYISLGALTHSAKIMDISLKAVVL